jgi:hypothetical protein
MLPCAMNTIAVPMGVPSVVYPVMNQPGEPLIQGGTVNVTKPTTTIATTKSTKSYTRPVSCCRAR